MTFIHKPYQFVNLDQTDINGERFYLNEDKKYRSVTTVLGRIPNPGLDKWRKSVGLQKSVKIAEQAAGRGSRIHKMCENYLFGQQYRNVAESATELLMFQQIQRVLNKHVDVVYNSEFCLYSDKLRTAGRADLLCNFDGVPTILDFKTARKIKKMEQIQNYFWQVTAYSMMLYERQNISVPNFVILICNEQQNIPQVVAGNIKPYYKDVIKIFANQDYNPIC